MASATSNNIDLIGGTTKAGQERYITICDLFGARTRRQQVRAGVDGVKGDKGDTGAVGATQELKAIKEILATVGAAGRQRRDRSQRRHR